MEPMDWEQKWIAPLVEEGRNECRKCDGRSHGDCSDGCRWFYVLASPEEKAPRKVAKKRKWRGTYGRETEHSKATVWRGPTGQGWCDKEEVA